jgi:2-iminobutanoate/2-iminopropanoate deaminase
MKQPRNPATVHPPVGRYVHQVEVSGESRLLFISGQVGRRLDGSVPDDPVAQYGVALENVVANLVAAGFEPADVVKITTYAVGPIDAVGRRAELDRVLGEHVTTSTFVYVAALAAPEFKVEIEAWATKAH